MIGLPIAKPCPFCGSTEVDECVKEIKSSNDSKQMLIIFMKCYVCDASAKSYAFAEGDESEYWDAWSHALDAWNRRADDGKAD